LLAARWLDGSLTIPFREAVGTAPADAPAENAPFELPPLWLSTLPVVLPVLLISVNTALNTLANSEHAPRVSFADIRDWDQLRELCLNPQTPPAQRLSDALQLGKIGEVGARWDGSAAQQEVLAALNRMLVGKSPQLYEAAAFDEVLPKRWQLQQELQAAEGGAKEVIQRKLLLDDLLQKDVSKLQVHELERVNRLLLEVSFPEVFAFHVWETPTRRAASWSALFGNANFALLLSTLVALYLYWRQRGATLEQISQTVETALMSGGTIILITAAGGSFGAMLKVAGIGTAIENLFRSSPGAGGAPAGLVFLLLGYGVAALLKVAQGSSTTAMIVVSGMLAAMVSGPEQLGFHPVYLATAIGAGSLLGSWMNDSGFWIFAKMGRLTEAEALKSWTVLLVVLSLTSLLTTIVLAFLMPLT
jgi:H+/gluconate symporter-like permease